MIHWQAWKILVFTLAGFYFSIIFWLFLPAVIQSFKLLASGKPAPSLRSPTFRPDRAEEESFKKPPEREPADF